VRPIGSISVLAIVGGLTLAASASASTLALSGGFGDQDVVMTLADRNDVARAFKVSFGNIAIDVGAGNDTISDAPQSGANVDGGLGDDAITADQGTNMGLIDGGLGDDRISTGPLAVVAQLTGGFGDDRIVSQNGTSTISGGFGRDFIDGHDEADTIDCGAGLDRFVQYAGDTVSNCEVPQA
jgi:Ca2+-binding RTX toxin-like protein